MELEWGWGGVRFGQVGGVGKEGSRAEGDEEGRYFCHEGEGRVGILACELFRLVRLKRSSTLRSQIGGKGGES